MEKNKVSVNIVEWKDGKLTVTDVKCNTVEEAKEFVNIINGNQVTIKIYDSLNNNVIHVKNNNCDGDTYA